ncbi:MAG: STAS domain-containing protein [Chloroflexi bacterium]|nr:STAS domain-containing protein [Chloroflexota bacterium]
MEIVGKKLGDINVLSISGRLDALYATEMEKALESLLNAGQLRLVIDFASLDYISSSGLRVFLSALKKVRKQEGDIKMSQMKPCIREVFDMSGFSQLFKIFDTDDEAIQGF